LGGFRENSRIQRLIYRRHDATRRKKADKFNPFALANIGNFFDFFILGTFPSIGVKFASKRCSEFLGAFIFAGPFPSLSSNFRIPFGGGKFLHRRLHHRIGRLGFLHFCVFIASTALSFNGDPFEAFNGIVEEITVLWQSL
jgi:hypothetical protein